MLYTATAMPNDQGNRRAVPVVTEDRIMSRRVRLTERLGCTRGWLKREYEQGLGAVVLFQRRDRLAHGDRETDP